MPPANRGPRRWQSLLFVFSGLVSSVGVGGRPPELMLPIHARFVLHRYDLPDATRRWIRFPLAVALMVGLAFLGSLGGGTIAMLFGGLPPKRSIVEHPFWWASARALTLD